VRSYSISYPAQTAGGEYTFTIGPAIVDLSGNPMDQDADGTFGEPIKDIFSGTVTFASPDLEIISATLPTEVQNGDTVSIEWVVQNNGGATAARPWTDRVYLSTDNVRGNDVFVGSFDHSRNLASNASYTVTANPVIPANTAVGDYFVLVETDSTNRVDELTAEGNNISARGSQVSIALTPLPDPEGRVGVRFVGGDHVLTHSVPFRTLLSHRA
jgi:hypothetical protein